MVGYPLYQPRKAPLRMNTKTEEQKFSEYVRHNIDGMARDAAFIGLSQVWVRECIRHNYAQNFTWLGRPVIQVPQDIYAIQELVWACRPDLIIENRDCPWRLPGDECVHAGVA